MERIPDTSYTLVHTLDGLCDLSQLFAASITQELGLLHNLFLLQAAYANGLFAAVDICALDDGVFARTRRDGDFDLGVGAGKGWKIVLEESAGALCQSPSRKEDVVLAYFMPLELPAQSQ